MYFTTPNNLPIGRGSRVLLFPILSDINHHRCENRLSFLYVHNLDTDEWGIVNHHHCDTDGYSDDWLLEYEWPEKLYSYNSGVLSKYGIQSYDVRLLYWLRHGDVLDIEYTPNIQTYHRWNYRNEWTNDTIPVTLHIEWIQQVIRHVNELWVSNSLERAIRFYTNLLSNLNRIEDSGIDIDSEKLKQFYGFESQKLYTEYNLFTITGRPSNSFGGINFAALPKHTGVREMITTHSDSEILVEFDYKSHHLHLVADLVGYQFPDGNIHEYFGRQYFGVDELTSEQYEESKGVTFALLYGNMKKSDLDIPFFNRVDTYIKRLWRTYKRLGYVELPLSGRRLVFSDASDMKPNKLFNYLIQAHETETNSVVLSEVLLYLYSRKSKLILYTYDSFLFQFHRDDGKEFITEVSNTLSRGGIDVSVSYGNNYGNMKQLKM